MERDEDHFRHLLLYCFDSKKKWLIEAHRFISKIYSESAPSVKTCETSDDLKVMIWKTKNV